MAHRKRVTSHVFPTLPPENRNEALLRKLAYSKQGIPSSTFPEKCAELWQSLHLASLSEFQHPAPPLSFAFLQGINFELTYGCNLSCSHCLQSGLRLDGSFKWIDTERAKQAIKDAAWLGIKRNGINLTGGEIYLPGSPLLTLIDQATQSGLKVRSNTNGWWGARKQFTIGQETFTSDKALIANLKHRGLTILAMSLDNRYLQYPDMSERVLQIASLCEQCQLHYEFVATDTSEEILDFASQILREKLGRDPEFLIFSPMGKIDLGAAAHTSTDTLDTSHFAEDTLKTPCLRSGFTSPYFLHISPSGGVRSCLYAPGASYMGNITHDRLLPIINRFEHNPINVLFQNQNLQLFVDQYITPWKHIYRAVTHPCAVSSLISRIADAILTKESQINRKLTHQEQESIHSTIATEYNIFSTRSSGAP
jgi:organic radical activating enzyme